MSLDDVMTQNLSFDDECVGRSGVALIIGLPGQDCSAFGKEVVANGYEVVFADGLDAGLELALRNKPSIVLFSISFPVDDSRDAADIKKIREAAGSGKPSIIAFASDAGRSGKDACVHALSSGADDFVSTPVDGPELAAKLRTHLKLHDFYRELEEDKRNLETLLAITAAISATLDASEVLNIIVSKVADVTGAVRCSIVLAGEKNEGYVLASHEDRSVRELKIDLSRYPEIRQAIETKRTIAIDDIVNHPIMSSVRDKVSDLKEMSALIVPIVFNDEALGTLFLRVRRRERGFSRKEIDFCGIVANSAFHAMRNARMFARLMQEKNTLQEIAVKDHLTSLFNHNFFYSRLEEEFDRAVRYDMPLSVIMIDIDDFKEINDRHGHIAGDTVLRDLSAMVKKGVRKTDIVARYGGDEFAVILPHTGLNGALEEGERLREIIESHAYAGLIKENITISVGVSSYPQKTAMNAGELVNSADVALYKAKWSGKNCVRATD